MSTAVYSPILTWSIVGDCERNIAFTHIIILMYSPAGAFQNGTSLRGNVPSIRPRNRVQITLPAFIV